MAKNAMGKKKDNVTVMASARPTKEGRDITLQALLTVIPSALGELMECRLSFRAGFKARRLMQVLEAEMKAARDAQVELIKLHGGVDHGGNIAVPPERQVEYIQKFNNEFAPTTVHVEFEPLGEEIVKELEATSKISIRSLMVLAEYGFLRIEEEPSTGKDGSAEMTLSARDAE